MADEDAGTDGEHSDGTVPGARGSSGADAAPGGSEPDGPPHRLPETEGELDRALTLVRFLRRHCSWDASQTPDSLVPHLLEETHEVVDAIRNDDGRALEGELGDLLLNLAFQVVIGEEEERFDARSVADQLERKMKERHPHLFGLGEREEWERIKARNRPDEGVLDGLAPGLDPLTRAHRIQERVSGVGFDWAEPRGAWQKTAEELDEVREALEEGASDELEEELGDLLFAAVNLVRLTGNHPVTLLEAANRKFTARFRRLESLAAESEIDLERASLETLDELWEELKAERDRAPDDEGGIRKEEGPEEEPATPDDAEERET